MEPEKVRQKLLDAVLAERRYIESFRAIGRSETAETAIDFELMGIECALFAIRECSLSD